VITFRAPPASPTSSITRGDPAVVVVAGAAFGAEVVDELGRDAEDAVERTADRSPPQAPITVARKTASTPTRTLIPLATGHDTATPPEPVRVQPPWGV